MYLFRWITLINFIFFQIGHLQINEKSEENGKFVNNKTQKTGFFKEKLFFLVVNTSFNCDIARDDYS